MFILTVSQKKPPKKRFSYTDTELVFTLNENHKLSFFSDALSSYSSSVKSGSTGFLTRVVVRCSWIRFSSQLEQLKPVTRELLL